MLAEMPAGQREDRWRLTAAALLLCHAIFLWRRLVCLSQFEASGQVSAFIEYMELKITPGSPIRAGGCEWPGRPDTIITQDGNSAFRCYENVRMYFIKLLSFDN